MKKPSGFIPLRFVNGEIKYYYSSRWRNRSQIISKQNKSREYHKDNKKKIRDRKSKKYQSNKREINRVTVEKRRAGIWKRRPYDKQKDLPYALENYKNNRERILANKRNRLLKKKAAKKYNEALKKGKYRQFEGSEFTLERFCGFNNEQLAIKEMTSEEYISKYSYIAKYVSEKTKIISSVLTKEDLYSIGLECLLKIRDKYNPDKNCSFESFAKSKIKWAILDELRFLKEDLSRGGNLPFNVGEDERRVFDLLHVDIESSISNKIDLEIIYKECTERERKLIRLILNDSSLKEIAESLCVSQALIYKILEKISKKR